MEKVILFICLMGICTGCDVNSFVSKIDIPYAPKIVIMGFIQPNKAWEVSVRSNQAVPNAKDAFSETAKDLKQATVKLYEDGHLLGNLTYDPSLKAFTGLPEHLAQAGKTYRIEVVSSGFPAASAETKIPFPAQVENWDLQFLTDQKGSEKEILLNFDIKDANIEKDFYEVSYNSEAYINHSFSGNESSSLLTIQDEVVLAAMDFWDKITQFQDNGRFICDRCTFPDSFFNHKRHRFSFKIVPSLSDGKQFNHVRHHLVIQQMNEDLYRFRSSRDKQTLTEGDPLFPIVAIQSNVKGGLGVFGAYYETEKHFEVN